MTKYQASYNNSNGHCVNLNLDATTELGAKREATKRGSYGQSINLVELDPSGDAVCCIASKSWGGKWESENV